MQNGRHRGETEVNSEGMKVGQWSGRKRAMSSIPKRGTCAFGGEGLFSGAPLGLISQ